MMDQYFQNNPMHSQEQQQQGQQEQQRQFQPQQQHGGMSGQEAGQPNQQSMAPPNSQHLMQSMAMAAPEQHSDISMAEQEMLQRRKSMPLGYPPQATQDPTPRRMSMVGDHDAMAYSSASSNQNAGFLSYQGFPVLNNPDLAPENELGVDNGMNDSSSFLSSDVMASMVSNQYSGMNMGSVFNPSVTSGPVGRQMLQAQVGGFQTEYPLNAQDGTYDSTTGAMGRAPFSSFSSPGGDVPGTRISQYSQLDTSGQDMTPSSSSVERSSASAEPNARSISRHVSSAGSSAVSPNTKSTTGFAQTSSTSSSNTPNTSVTPRDLRDKSIYSKSGFDMLKALWLVASRKDPKIHLGAVDMSCAFVVCDVTMNDCPIIYVSDNFQNLTGYSRHEIVGQNCRFLQAPDGKIEAGAKREFVDNDAVYNLKKMIHERKEVQQSLINYRKGGKPFLNLLTMIPIPWDTEEIRYFIGFQIDLVECPDAIAGSEFGGVAVNYKHSDIGQYIWTPPNSTFWDNDNGQTLGVDDVSTLLQQFNAKGIASDWHKQSWDKMLLENCDDFIHVLSLKGLFLYLSPACKRLLEYDCAELVGNSLSSICHPSDIVPVTRELKDATSGSQVNIVFRIRRKVSGYTWFESHGSLYVEQGKGRKCIILVGRKRPVFTLSRRNLEAHGGIGDSELWTKLSTSGTFLYVSSNVRSLLDLQPESLVATSIQELMRKDSRPEFGRAMEKARRGKIVTCKHEVLNRRGQGLQAQTTLYPGDASEGHKPSFLLAQTKLLKASSRALAPAMSAASSVSGLQTKSGQLSQPAGGSLPPGSQDAALASDDNIFDELRTTKCSSWQFELRQMEKVNRILAEELGGLLSSKKKRKRRKGVGNIARDCANCHTKNTPEWRRGPSGQRDLCNSCGLRWAKQVITQTQQIA
ncbi:blue light receptor [Lecanicillium sp. MT-2017a]|nr:blue light receptor [Lecanicillium sp. MT-2017a]